MSDRASPPMSDDALIQLLADAWAPPRLEPRPASVAEVRLAFARGADAGAGPLWRRLVSRPRAGRGWRARLALSAATVGVVVVGAGTAFAAGAPVPAPLRQFAYDVGLPVTPPALVEVQGDAQTVRADLAPGSGASPGTTAHDAGALARALRQLSPAERASVTWPEGVLARACRLFSVQPASASASASTVPDASEACPPAGASPGSGQWGGGSLPTHGTGVQPGGPSSTHGSPPGAGQSGSSGTGASNGGQPGSSGSGAGNRQPSPGSGSSPGSGPGGGRPPSGGGSGASTGGQGSGQSNRGGMPAGSAGGSGGAGTRQ